MINVFAKYIFKMRKIIYTEEIYLKLCFIANKLCANDYLIRLKSVKSFNCVEQQPFSLQIAQVKSFI